MEMSNLIKALAIIIVAFMALSMIAAGFLYAGDNSSSSSTDSEPLPSPTATPFTYSISFDTNAIKELGTIKVATLTSETDKGLVDSAVLKVEGVSKVSSQFRKTSLDANNWVYLADVTLKKNADYFSTVGGIFDLNSFDSSKRGEFFAAKYITVSAPPWVIIHNSDLNIDRNFSLTSSTLSAIVGLSTSAGDNLLVSGSIKISGSSIQELSLTEERNFSLENKFDFNDTVIVDNNSALNANEVVVDANSPGLN